MSTSPSHGRSGSRRNGHKPTLDELRAQVEDTRWELGRTVEALAAKADVKERARQTAAETRTHVAEKSGQAKGQLAHMASTAGGKLRGKAPEAVDDHAHQAAEKARRNPAVPLLAGAAVAVALLMLARHKRRH